ncbi:hypothetical protein D5086_015282 [Populus alba]|uniref:Uncharacterized protein n=1 Tax=Populus alba TaxID=43335 RepID=A0ACC4C172_POPAL
MVNHGIDKSSLGRQLLLALLVNIATLFSSFASVFLRVKNTWFPSVFSLNSYLSYIRQIIEEMEARFGMPIVEELVELVEEVLPPPPGGPKADGGIDENEEEDGDGEENDEEKKSCR